MLTVRKSFLDLKISLVIFVGNVSAPRSALEWTCGQIQDLHIALPTGYAFSANAFLNFIVLIVWFKHDILIITVANWEKEQIYKKT